MRGRLRAEFFCGALVRATLIEVARQEELSLGISQGDVFRKVFAGAPGVMQPSGVRGKPAIFLAHGRQDATMPIDATSRKFVVKLKALEYDVTYREYEGRHSLPPEVLREVFEWLRR